MGERIVGERIVDLVGPDVVAQRAAEVPSMASASRVAIVALTGLLLWSLGQSQPWVWWVLLAFGAAAVTNLWRVTTGRAWAQSHLLYFWSTALYVLLIARGTEGGALLLVLFLYPLTMCTALHGLRHGLLLAACSAAGWLFGTRASQIGQAQAIQALALLLTPLIMAAVAHPMAALRQRMQLAADLHRELDPRRGLVAVGQEVGERLRQATAARRVLLCHRDAELPTVVVCDSEDGAFVASDALAGRVLALLHDLPTMPMALHPGQASVPGGTGQRQESAFDQPLTSQAVLQELAQLLHADRLQLVPDAPGQARSGWILVAYEADADRRQRPWPLQPLAGFATDVRRLLQQASYVDQLQAEIAAHERSRIGRDLHDSAIQPYLGLKFAIEGLALRCDPANPLHTTVQELRSVCDAELVELRKTVSALRTGDADGDNSLATALQRQCARFARLFEIQVELQMQPDLPVNRSLVSALLHMVNEGLNNVRRHTCARQVWVQLSHSPGTLRLLIRDDAGRLSGQPAPAFEPRSLAERARELGGALELRRHDGLDTELHITVPA